MLKESSICNLILNGFTKIIVYKNNSTIIHFSKNLSNSVIYYYLQCHTKLIGDRIRVNWKMLLNGSFFIKLIFKDSNIENIWQASIMFRFINWKLEFLRKIIRSMYLKNEDVFTESFTVYLLKKFLKKAEYIVGIPLFIMLIATDGKWCNVYGIYLLALTIILYMTRAIVLNHEFINLKAIEISVLFFFVVTIISTITSFNINLSMRFLVFNITGILFMTVILTAIKTESAMRNFLKILMLGLFVSAVYGVWQKITGSIPFDPSQSDIVSNQGAPGRIYSFMGNPNNYAQVIVIFAPYLIGMFYNFKKLTFKFLTIFFISFISLALLFTGSRSGWIGFSIASIIILFYEDKKLVPIVFLGFLISFQFMPGYLTNRIYSIFNSSSDSSVKFRSQILETVTPIIKDYYLTGIGLGTDIFGKVIQNYKIYTARAPMHTHILYTQIILEMGVMGIITFSYSIIRLIRRSLVSIISKGNQEIKSYLVCAIASLVGILLIGMIEYIWFYPRVLIFFWINIGIIMICLNLLNQRTVKEILDHNSKVIDK